MVDNLKDHHMHELKAVYNLFDTQVEDGKISKQEMNKMLNKLGVEPSKTELEDFFQNFDQDGDGKIDFAEFISMMTKKFERSESEENEEL